MVKKRLRSEFEYAGYIWETSGDGYLTRYEDHVQLHTWEFGDIHQCKIYAEDGVSSVGFCMPYEHTREDAMDKLVRTASTLDRCLKTPEELQKQSLEDFPSLFPPEEPWSWADYVFYTGGNGYTWYKGCVVDSTIKTEAEREWPQKKLTFDRPPEIVKRPRTRYVSSVGPHSLVTNVPDNVRDDWLRVAYRAAHDLLTLPVGPGGFRSEDYNLKQGTKVLRDLKKRFGHRLKELKC